MKHCKNDSDATAEAPNFDYLGHFCNIILFVILFFFFSKDLVVGSFYWNFFFTEEIVPVITTHSKVCGSSRARGGAVSGKRVPVQNWNWNDIFPRRDHCGQNPIRLHCIGIAAEISET